MSDYYFTCACAACVYFAYAAIYVLFAYAGDELPDSILGRFNYVAFQWFGFRIICYSCQWDYFNGIQTFKYGVVFAFPATGWEGRYWPVKKPKTFHLLTTKSPIKTKDGEPENN